MVAMGWRSARLSVSEFPRQGSVGIWEAEEQNSASFLLLASFLTLYAVPCLYRKDDINSYFPGCLYDSSVRTELSA